MLKIFKPKDMLITVLLFSYLIGAFLTYGYTRAVYHSRHSGLIGAAWPIYWCGWAVGRLGDASESIFTDEKPERP